MNELQRAGQSGALDVAASQAAAKSQIATMLDMLRQLGGNPSVVSGTGGSADPLNAPFTLYVDPYIGSDRFLGGAYNSREATGTDEQIIAQKLKRIELQRLECGYTASRPFRTINRAVIEAAIITSKNWYTYNDPRAHVDCVTIVLSGGVHIVYNDPGSSSTSLASWGTLKDPTIAELIAFNPTTGGVLSPRGCSMHGQDLRKTSVRPNWVTAVVDELADYSNRRAIFKVSGTGFFFNATTMDKIGHTESVHLLDTFHPASQAELNAFYLKIQSSVGTGADLATALLAARPSEYQIVGPIDQSLAPTSAWDTTTGASPYIFNWSTRSEYGMGGAFWDGAKIAGLKSMVCANFTGTQQQKDMRCWQVYESGAWVTLPNTPEGYQQYIDTAPDNLRRNPARQSRHISAINDAYIQKVSIFGIGQSEVTMVDSGGEITDNGGNSTFGGSSALAKGYKGFAFGKDRNWAVNRLKVPLNLSEKTSNIRRIELGVVSAISGSAITLTSGLAFDSNSPATPSILRSLGYSFASGTRIWIDNPAGDDWRATLSANAWSSSTPASIGITAAPLQSGTDAAAGSAVIGRRVYLRRVVDTRAVAERRVSLLLNNTASARLPQRNAVLQTDPTRSGGGISRALAVGGEEVLIVTNVGTGTTPGAGVLKTSELTIRRGAASNTYVSGSYYRQGTIVKHAGKHWQAKQTFVSSGASPDPLSWGETFVHMPSDFNPEDSVSQEAPIITLDTDISDADNSTTLGINWTTEWTNAGPTRDQYRSSADYLGCYAFLRALGFTDAAAHAALVPQAAANRQRDPSSSAAFPTAPTGGAATGLGNWAVEFRRPSTLRLYNHQWEWAGFGNYSKAMPVVQGDMSEFNKFTYYFTSAAGGRVTPKGSNEDGFEVTPKGLEDIATGATISPESLGGQGIDEAQRTDFPNGIQVGGEAVLQDVIISGNADFSSQSQGQTNKRGPLQLANAEEMRSIAAISGATDTERDASINQDPKVVTSKTLNYWKIENRLTSARPGVQFVYIDPVNGRDISDINALFSAPPLTQTGNDSSETRAAAAVRSLKTAADYVNQAFGPTTTVEFRCGPGVYLDTGTITFSTIARIRAWDFSANNYLNDDKAGGTRPFMGSSSNGATWTQDIAYFLNPTNHPVFLTRPEITFQLTPENAIYNAIPLLLKFEQSGSATGLVWWGPMHTITSAAVPDSYFVGRAAASTWRPAAIADFSNSLNHFIKAQLATSTSSEVASSGVMQYSATPCIDFLAAGSTINIAISAIGPAVSYMPRVFHSVFQSAGDPVVSRGLYLIGNVNISSALSGAFPLRTVSTYQITGFAESLFGIDNINKSDSGITLNYGGFREVTAGTGVDVNYNFTWNNIHLVNNALAYPTAANDTSPVSTGWTTVGPALSGVLGYPLFIGTTSNVFWHSFGVVSATNFQGFAGKFGNYGISNDSALNARTKGIASVRDGFEVKDCVLHFFLRQAGTASEPANSGYPAAVGDVGANENFDALNAQVTPVTKGVSVTRPTKIIKSIKI
jgi:hypothetical protein